MSSGITSQATVYLSRSSTAQTVAKPVLKPGPALVEVPRLRLAYRPMRVSLILKKFTSINCPGRKYKDWAWIASTQVLIV